ncbi:ABC transporter permease [Georgenia muralis]
MGRDAGILARQVRHELATLLRTPITLILSVAFPLAFFVLLAALLGNETIDVRGGVRLAQFLAPGMASFGVVMASFSFLAVGLAEARATGVLKRQGGTPLPRWALLGGRVGAAVLLGLLACGLVLGTGAAFYGVQILGRTMLAVVVTLAVASLTFSMLGLALALLLPTPQATLAVTNGIVIPLAFVSDIFMVGGQMPAWMESLGWAFPLKHLVALFGDALNPFLAGSGFQLDHLAVLAAWGVAGAALAAWALRPGRPEATARTRRVRARPGDAVPRRAARPSAAALVGGQVAHTHATLWRDASAVFFAVVFPVVLVAVVPTVNGGGDLVMDDGQQLGVFYAATMAVYGAAVTAYVNMPSTLAEDRERGALKRVRGTPLPTWAMLAGRVVGALVVALLTLVLIAVLARVMFAAPLQPGWAVALGTFVLAAVCFAVLGIAVASLVRSAQGAVGVALGTLLPLAFISDIFVVGVAYPPVVDAIGWFFPLRHAARAMTDAVAPGAAGPAWAHLAVLAAWTVTGVVVLALRFRWEPHEAGARPGRRTRGERRRRGERRSRRPRAVAPAREDAPT